MYTLGYIWEEKIDTTLPLTACSIFQIFPQCQLDISPRDANEQKSPPGAWVGTSKIASEIVCDRMVSHTLYMIAL
jgi:hypothetical protein